MLLASVVLFGLGCRASAEDCREVALHVIALAEAEATGTSSATSAEALELECNAQRPSRGLVECMLGAQTLTELDGC